MTIPVGRSTPGLLRVLRDRVAGTFSLQRGEFFGGHITAVGYSRGRIEVTPQLSIEPLNRIELPEGDFTDRDGPRDLYVDRCFSAVSCNSVQRISSCVSADTSASHRCVAVATRSDASDLGITLVISPLEWARIDPSAIVKLESQVHRDANLLAKAPDDRYQSFGDVGRGALAAGRYLRVGWRVGRIGQVAAGIAGCGEHAAERLPNRSSWLIAASIDAA